MAQTRIETFQGNVEDHCRDLPLGVISRDAVAQGDGAPQGRELEIAELLSFIKHANIHNTVWLTADMHYTRRITMIRTWPRSRISSRSGIHLRAAPCRDLGPTETRQYLRSAGRLAKGL